MTEDYAGWGTAVDIDDETGAEIDDEVYAETGDAIHDDAEDDAEDKGGDDEMNAGTGDDTAWSGGELEDDDNAAAPMTDVDAGTGHPAVDAAVRAVANASELPVAEQLAAYEGAHETLREVLASIED